jgi:peroxiredoxin
MKKIKLFPVIIILLSLATLGLLGYNIIIGAKTVKRLPVGAPIPELLVSDVETDQNITLADLKGKVLFINFWASWSRDSIEEMPHINRLYKTLKKNPGFKMLPLIFNDNSKNCLEYIKKMGYSIPVISDPLNKTALKFGITEVPETFIVDKKGIIRKVKLNPGKWDSKENVEWILSLIKE